MKQKILIVFSILVFLGCSIVTNKEEKKTAMVVKPKPGEIINGNDYCMFIRVPVSENAPNLFIDSSQFIKRPGKIAPEYWVIVPEGATMLKFSDGGGICIKEGQKEVCRGNNPNVELFFDGDFSKKDEE